MYPYGGMAMTDSASVTEPAAARGDGSAAVTPAERERRLRLITEVFLDGASQRQLVETAVQTWGVSWRTAQAYVHDVQERLRAEAQQVPPMFALQLSQMQRNRFLRGLVLRTRQNGELSLRDYCTLASTFNKLLDSRDRSAAHMLNHQEQHQSNQEDAIIRDWEGRVRELMAGGAALPPAELASTRRALPDRSDAGAMPVLSNPAVRPSEDPDEDDDDIDMSQLTEEEQEEARMLQEIGEEMEQERAAAEREHQWRAAETAIARNSPSSGKAAYPTRSADSQDIPGGPAPGSEPNPSPKSSRLEELRSERKRRRQERKRLRRLRKRRRG
jgi:hypothetical protein